jgi:hypothetical protein
MGGLAFLMGHAAPEHAATGEPVASAQAMSDAWSLAESAQNLSDAHQSAAALAQWQRAYDLSSDPMLLLEVARLEREVGNGARATHAFEVFLERAGDRVSEQRRVFAARQLQSAAVNTARLNVQTNVVDAVVELEPERGVATGSGFVVSVLLDAGERRLSLSKPGYDTQSLVLSLEPGEVRALRVDLDKAAAGRSESSSNKPRFSALERPLRGDSEI